MNNENKELSLIKDKIFTIRGIQVMIDSDLAGLYEVETKNLNKAVKRNIERFPVRFRFQLDEEEYNSLRFQIGTLKEKKSTVGQHTKYLPFVFTEQGVSMLSAVLRSEIAAKISIQIMDAFVSMRKFMSENGDVFQRLDNIELKQLQHKEVADDKFNQIFDALETKSLTQNNGIFFDGQMFDAYKLASDIIRKAKKSIILIDNYVDDNTLQLFTKSSKNVDVTIYTKSISKTLSKDLEKYNSQYKPIEIKTLKSSHDRFLILDQKTVYHIGASLKDLGKKWFAFSKIGIDVNSILDKLD